MCLGQSNQLASGQGKDKLKKNNYGLLSIPQHYKGWCGFVDCGLTEVTSSPSARSCSLLTMLRCYCYSNFSVKLLQSFRQGPLRFE